MANPCGPDYSSMSTAEMVREIENKQRVIDHLNEILERIAKANVIFPSMCANNVEAWNIVDELKYWRELPQDGSRT